MANRVTKIFGPPGTGKTTYLLNLVDRLMGEERMKPERIAYVSFTKRAADEAVRRATERFGFSPERMPNFRTLHSMAFRSLSASRDDIMQEEHFRQLCRSLGFQFTSLDDEFTFLPLGTALGDRVTRIEALSRVRQSSLKKEWERREWTGKDIPWLAVQQWAEALARFKQSNGMLDYTDLLEKFDETLDVDVFIVDEAQDLSALQWHVVRRASAKASRVFLAGDDDQCIYSWAGADVERFLRLSGDVEVLPRSFRVPARVQQLANVVVSRILRRQPKNWEPREEQGEIRRVRYETAIDLSGRDSWMLIARNHSELKRFEQMLWSSGYPYLKDHRHSTDDQTTRAILAWEHWRRGLPLAPKDISSVAKRLDALASFRPRETVLLRDAPLPDSLKQKTWMDALQIEPRRREYIRACLANRESLTAKPRITVSTIHRVKGGEADHVCFIPDLSMTPWKQQHTDEEQRVLYVALTRARKTLTIVQPQSNMSYQI